MGAIHRINGVRTAQANPQIEPEIALVSMQEMERDLVA